MTMMNKAETYDSQLIDELLKDISPKLLEKTEKRMLLAARIDKVIKARKWKKKDFAKALGKTPSEITKWLSGTHNFTSDTLFDIERVLNIDLIKLANNPPEVTHTFIYNVISQSAQEPQGYWGALIYDKSLMRSYKAKGQFNTVYSD